MADRDPHGRQSWPRRGVLLAGFLGTATLGFLMTWLLTAPDRPAPSSAGIEAVRPAAGRSAAATRPAAFAVKATSSQDRFAEITGLQVLRVGVSGGGGVLDLRYRVVDKRKAESHVGHQVTPALIDAATGHVLATQWMGHAHPPKVFQLGRNYWMLFLNPGGLVERGGKVAVRLGHARLKGVAVE